MEKETTWFNQGRSYYVTPNYYGMFDSAWVKGPAQLWRNALEKTSESFKYGLGIPMATIASEYAMNFIIEIDILSVVVKFV